MKRELPFLPAIIALAAGLISSLVMLVNHIDTLKSLIIVFSFLIGFYVVGLILRAILLAVATKEEPEEEKEELENIDLEDSEPQDKE